MIIHNSSSLFHYCFSQTKKLNWTQAELVQMSLNYATSLGKRNQYQIRINWYVDKGHGDFLSLWLVPKLLLLSLHLSLHLPFYLSLSISTYLSVCFSISPQNLSVFFLTSLVIWLLLFLSFALSYSSLLPSLPSFLFFVHLSVRFRTDSCLTKENA